MGSHESTLHEHQRLINVEDKFFSYFQIIEKEKENLQNPPQELLDELRSRAADYLRTQFHNFSQETMLLYMNPGNTSHQDQEVDRLKKELGEMKDQHYLDFFKMLQQMSQTYEEHLVWASHERMTCKW